MNDYEPTPEEIEDYETRQQRLAEAWQADEAAKESDRECQCESCRAWRKGQASRQDYSGIF